MKIGILNLEKLGRICIPKIIADNIGLVPKTEVEVFISHGEICIRKYDASNLKNAEFTGIIRRLDPLNRVTIPKEYLSILNIKVNSKVEFHLLEDNTMKVVKIN